MLSQRFGGIIGKSIIDTINKKINKLQSKSN